MPNGVEAADITTEEVVNRPIGAEAAVPIIKQPRDRETAAIMRGTLTVTDRTLPTATSIATRT